MIGTGYTLNNATMRPSPKPTVSAPAGSNSPVSMRCEKIRVSACSTSAAPRPRVRLPTAAAHLPGPETGVFGG
jgi:hypothetical protein